MKYYAFFLVEHCHELSGSSHNFCVQVFSLLTFTIAKGTYSQYKSGDADKVNVFPEIVYIPIEDTYGELSRQECLVSNVSMEDG